MESWFLKFKVDAKQHWLVHNKKNTKVKINIISSFWEKNFIFNKIIDIDNDQAFLINNAKGFNTINYNNGYDVVFTDWHYRVIKIFKLNVNEITPYIKDSNYCFIFKKNIIDLLKIKIGDVLRKGKIANQYKFK